MTKPRRRMTRHARDGLRAMASYWLTCLESWGRQFEGLPTTLEEEAEINAALRYLGMEQIDLGRLGDDETEED